MRKANTAQVRAALRTCDDGATLRELEDLLGVSADSLRNTLKTMPDAYIDRWQVVGGKTFAAVWCAVPVPEHCPRPQEMP